MFFQHLCRTLHPVLVSTFLDCASSVFTLDGKQGDTETMMVVTVSKLVSLLYGTILSGNENVSDRGLFSYITSYTASGAFFDVITIGEFLELHDSILPSLSFEITGYQGQEILLICWRVINKDLGYRELPGPESRILRINFPICPSFEHYFAEPLFINTKATI
jgi:hypothetical protein